jgi:hypothetical protein
MPPLAEAFSDFAENNELNEVTPSENAYFEFRQAIEPGFFNANFDLTPAKSSAHRSRRTGEPFVDQSLRNHILNGAAFGSRFNRALSKLGRDAALSAEELKVAFALYAVHDAHKTAEAQDRRQTAWTESKRVDADKDISDEELRSLLNKLGLTSFVGIEEANHSADIEVTFNEYLAAALATEKSSGRHNSVFSRPFANKYRQWVRLMDAAGGLSSPTAAGELQERANTICETVRLHYHHFQDVKGLTTNILTKALADRARTAGVKPIVFFEDGAIYLSGETEPRGTELLFSDESQVGSEFYDKYVEVLIESNPSLREVTGVRNSLNETNWPRGYLGITDTSFFFADSIAKASDDYGSAVAVAADAVRAEINQRADRDPNRYKIYETAIKSAVEVGLIETPPPTYQKPQLLGAFLGTLFRNLLWHDVGLCGKNYEQAVHDLATALDVPAAGQLYLQDNDKGTQPDDEVVAEFAASLDNSEAEFRSELEHGVSPSRQNRVECVFIALAYLYRDDSYDQRSLEAVLRDVQEDFLAYYNEWPEHWGETLAYWDADRSVETKQAAFTQRRTGNFPEAFPRYISRYLTIDGEQFPTQLDDPTFDEYLSPKHGSAQPRMCLLCREELLGDSNSLSDYETNTDEVGRSLTFTHLRKLAPESGETNSVVCPICQFELNIRNTVHQTSTDSDSAYLFLAPDYFHSPVDLAIANRVNTLLNSSVGSFVDLARQLITSDISSRAESAESFLEIFETDDSEDFQRTIQNYDSSYTGTNMLGVFRIDVPTRSGGSDPVNRTTFWTLARYIAHVLSWGTGSRVLLSDSPFPAMSFDEFDQMVMTEGLPAPVTRQLSPTSTISSRRDLDVSPEAIDIIQPQAGNTPVGDSAGSSPDTGDLPADTTTPIQVDDDEQSSRATSSKQATLTETLESTAKGSATEPDDTKAEGNDDQSANERKQSEPTQETLTLRTEFGVDLYRQSALLCLTNMEHGYDIQRVTTLLDALSSPFAGANSVLKGNDTNETYSAQFGALVLDTTTHPSMNNTLQTLADHGFEVLSPESTSEASTYDYERLFRVGCDALSDGFAEEADRELMIQTVAGEVAKTGSRINQNRSNNYDPSEGHLSDEAIAFAEVFIDDLFIDICSGDYYQLRRLQNRLASGFNLAMREAQREFFAELNSDDDEGPAAESDSSTTTSTTQ